jgi:effector-binding domain-containing protein
MIDTPQIIQTTAQHTGYIHLTITLEEMQKVFGPTVGDLMGVLSAQGIAPAGPVFAHHLRGPDDTFDFELSVPVGKPVIATGRVQPGQWPSMRVARTVHHGPYEGLPEAWGKFMGWIEANGHQPAQDLYECYLTNPESDPDPATWRTELNRPLIG